METTILMGIANLTDNSFVAGDRMGIMAVEAVVNMVGEMFSDGAGIVDIGACSTAPGNAPVSVEEELSRMEKYLPPIFSAFPKAVFSIDSFRIDVAERVCELAQERLDNIEKQLWINDISSSDALVNLAATRNLTYVAMDSGSDPVRFFRDFSSRAEKAGLENWIPDPGFGFGKTIGQNWAILNDLQCLLEFGRPILVALSRKRMIYEPAGLTSDTCADLSVGAELLAVSKGASIIRTHDLALHRNRSRCCQSI